MFAYKKYKIVENNFLENFIGFFFLFITICVIFVVFKKLNTSVIISLTKDGFQPDIYST